MKNSIIAKHTIGFHKKLRLYYSHSLTDKLFKKLSHSVKQLCTGSAIIHFFSKRWKTDTAWKNSAAIKVVLFPFRLVRLVSLKAAVPVRDSAAGSLLVGGTVRYLNNMFAISSRVYGLFLLAFTVTEGMLWAIKGPVMLKYLILRLVLLVLAVLLIAINRSVKVLFNGSAVFKLITNFFVVRGIENGTDFK